MDDRSTAHTLVCERIREEIFSGELPPGCRLTVASLAKRYRFSPMPIRTALQELRGQGLVTGEPRRGAKVRSVDAEFVSNVYDLRMAVLQLIYVRCVRFITNADIEELEGIQAELDEAAGRDDVTAVRHWNHVYHRAISRIARNPEAADVIERNWGLVDAMRSQYGFGPGRMRDANEIHHKVIGALRQRDAETAFEWARLSAERSRDDLVVLVQQHAQRPQAARRDRGTAALAAARSRADAGQAGAVEP